MSNQEEEELIEMLRITSQTKTFKLVLEPKHCKFLYNLIEDVKYLREKQKKGR